MNLFRWLFTRVTYTCTFCEVVQTIPLRRVHVFERFYGLTEGQPVLIRCPRCRQGLQCPLPRIALARVISSLLTPRTRHKALSSTISTDQFEVNFTLAARCVLSDSCEVSETSG